ncbi:unnamed protein product, partial [Musa textilis]
ATSVFFDQTPHGARRHGHRRYFVTELNKALAADRSPTRVLPPLHSPALHCC